MVKLATNFSWQNFQLYGIMMFLCNIILGVCLYSLSSFLVEVVKLHGTELCGAELKVMSPTKTQDGKTTIMHTQQVSILYWFSNTGEH